MEQDISVQIEDNSSSIEYILRQITFVSWFLGAGIARPPKCHKIFTIILRIIYFGICSADIYFGVKTLNLNLENVKSKSDSYYIVFYICHLLRYVLAYYYVYHGIGQYDKWPVLMSKLNNFDEKIRKETAMNDRLIKIIVLLAVLVTFICSFLLFMFEVYNYYFEPKYNCITMVIHFLFYYTMIQLLINSFIFDIIVYMLYYRFQTINKLFMQLDRRFTASRIIHKIRYIRELYIGICDVVSTVNDIYGLHLLLFSAVCCTNVVYILFYIYWYLINNEHYNLILQHIFICILYTAPFSLTCWICTLMCEESDKMGIIIHTFALNSNAENLNNLNDMKIQPTVEVSSENQDDEQNSNKSIIYNHHHVDLKNLRENMDRDCIRHEINDFSIQLQQYRVTINVCNFFDMNNALFTAFLGVIITYFIILVEFDDFESKISDKSDLDSILNNTLDNIRKNIRDMLDKINVSNKDGNNNK